MADKAEAPQAVEGREPLTPDRAIALGEVGLGFNAPRPAHGDVVVVAERRDVVVVEQPNTGRIDGSEEVPSPDMITSVPGATEH